MVGPPFEVEYCLSCNDTSDTMVARGKSHFSSADMLSPASYFFQSSLPTKQRLCVGTRKALKLRSDADLTGHLSANFLDFRHEQEDTCHALGQGASLIGGN